MELKKYISIAVCTLCPVFLCVYGWKGNGIKTREGNSEIYSRKDIKTAIDVIKEEFESEWSGCTLTDIYYAGDKVSQEYKEWAERYDADEVIVLLSSFDTDAVGIDGSLNPCQTYADWMWILVRTNNEEWQHVDHGY